MSNSARSASSSSPPDIPMNSQLRQSMSNSSNLASSSSPPVIPMDPQLRQLLEACSKGDFSLCIDLIDANPDIILSTTPYSNNCLHIAVMLGHHEFAKKVLAKAPSLFTVTNVDGETPLIAALMAANLSLASVILTAVSQNMQLEDLEKGRQLEKMLLKVDRRGENALHHAMRNGFENLALQLLEIQPRLSEQVTKTGESPMYMAARRGYSKVVERLLKIRSSADSDPKNESALHAAVRFGDKGIVMKLLRGRPQLVYSKGLDGDHPLERAVFHNNIELVKMFLKYDPNLAYIKNEKTQNTPFITAAQIGLLSIAEEIMSACPDSVYTPNKNGHSALQEAIGYEQLEFVDYIIKTPQLHRLINQATDNGSLPLHNAARMCNPELLRSLLSHAGQDYTAVNVERENAVRIVHSKTDLLKTLKWNESFTLLSNVIPSGLKHVIRDSAKHQMKNEAIQEVKSLTAKYTSNTSLVAALLATITFAAAFTLPGGFGTDPAEAGQPISPTLSRLIIYIFLDVQIRFMDMANAVAENLATEMAKVATGIRELPVDPTALEELGIEFQMLYDRYLTIPMDDRAGFVCPVGPGVLQPEGCHMSVGFEDIRDLMTYNQLDISILQVWTLYCRTIIPPTEKNNNDIAFLDPNLICETYITHYNETSMEYLVDALLQYKKKKLVFAPYH